MNRRMWAVSSGEYSDYRVLCLCTSKTEAEELAVKIRGEEDSWERDARVESFLVLDPSCEPIPLLRLSVNLWDDGTHDEERELLENEWPFRGDFAECTWRWVRAPWHKDKGGRLEATGTDLERVRKVFSEKKARLKADGVFRAKKEVRGGA